VAELKVQIVRLEDALAAETKRRVDATTQLDERARVQVYDLEERLRQQLQEDNHKLQERLATLEARFDELEQHWEGTSSAQMETIHKTSTDFGNALEHLQQEQDTERKARLRREGTLLQQVENHAKEFEDRWNAERQDRLERVRQLEELMDGQESKRVKEQAEFQRRVSQELESLRQELEEEVEERQIQDEDIVSALNRYTQQLQQSLSILSSD
jgi:uncharacterized protein YukE